jgi:hypothetical protein
MLMVLGMIVGVVVSILMLGFRFTANLATWPDPVPNVLTAVAVIMLGGSLMGMVVAASHREGW